MSESISFNGDVLTPLDYSLSITHLVPATIIVHLLADAIGLYCTITGAFSHRRATKNLVFALTIIGIFQKCTSLWTCFDYSPISSWFSRVVLSIYALVTVLFNLEVLKKLLAKISQQVSKRVKYLQYFLIVLYILLISLTFIKAGSLGVHSDGVVEYNGTVFGAFLVCCIAVEEINQIYMATLITRLAHSTKGNSKLSINRGAQAGILITVAITSILDLGSFTWVILVNNYVFGKETVAHVIISQDLMVWHCNLLVLTLYFTENLIQLKSVKSASLRPTSPVLEEEIPPSPVRKAMLSNVILSPQTGAESRQTEEPTATVRMPKETSRVNGSRSQLSERALPPSS